jgi:hypothetical protein
MTPSIAAVGLYCGIMALIAIWHGMIIGGWRRKLKISIGDGGNVDLTRAMRGHANFAENVPLALILLTYMALAGAPAVAIHVLGVMLTAGRLAHGLHFSKPGQPGWQRQAGAGLTLLVLLAGAVGAIGHSVMAML